MFNKKRIYLFILITLLLLSACGKKPIVDSSSMTPSEPTESISNTPIEPWKQHILRAVSNESWYKGPYSEFKDFESQKVNMEICAIEKNPEITNILFEKASKDIHGIEHYYAVDFNLNNKLEGSLNELIAGIVSDESLDGIRKQLKDWGCEPFLKDKIQFGKVTEPKFTQMTKEKQEVIQGISDYITENMKDRNDWNFAPGKYKVYIRNFSDNYTWTTSIVEDQKGDEWLLDVTLPSEKLDIDIHIPPEKIDTDALKYLANQYKKMSIKTFDVEF